MDTSGYADLVQAAQQHRLAGDDQRLQRLQAHANAGVPAAQTAMRQITEAGGAHAGSVNKMV